MESRRKRKLGAPPPPVPKDSVVSQYERFISNSRLDENGNPFVETSFQASSNSPEWTRINRQRPARSFQKKKKQLIDSNGGVGPPTLKCLVRRFLNRRLDDLTVGALRRVEWSVMKVVWEDVLLTFQDSFHVWSTFAAAYGDEPDFACHARTDLREETRTRREKLSYTVPLHSLIDPISSPSGAWIVHLNLLHCNGYSRDDLLGIPDIPNLGALCFSFNQNGTKLDDGIIRAWGRAAAQRGRLSMLKVLVLRNHSSITGRALEFLGWIDGLEVVELTGCHLVGTKFQDLKQNGWALDGGRLAEALEGERGVVGVMKDCQEEAERRKLVLQIGDMAPRGLRSGHIDSYVLRRDRETVSASTKQKRRGKGMEIGREKEIYPSTKKPRTIRDGKIKDMGELLAEFGSGPNGRTQKT